MAGGLRLPPPPPEVLTCDDIIRSGACNGGVASRLWRVANSFEVAAAESPARLLTLVPKEEQQHILAALDRHDLDGPASSNGDGYGDGYGDGDGDGDGDGKSSDGEGAYA